MCVEDRWLARLGAFRVCVCLCVCGGGVRGGAGWDGGTGGWDGSGRGGSGGVHGRLPEGQVCCVGCLCWLCVPWALFGRLQVPAEHKDSMKDNLIKALAWIEANFGSLQVWAVG